MAGTTELRLGPGVGLAIAVEICCCCWVLPSALLVAWLIADLLASVVMVASLADALHGL